MKKEQNTELPLCKFAKSNILINAAYNCSLLELQIIAIVLYKIANEPSTHDEDGDLVCCVSSAEIKSFLGITTTSIYHRLRSTSISMKKRVYIMENPKKREFELFSIFRKIKYENAGLCFVFEKDLENILKANIGSFTKLSVQALLSLNKTETFRLYEQLRSKAFSRSGEEKKESYKVEFCLEELMVYLGVADADNEKVIAALSGFHPNFEHAIALSKSSYKEWRDFKRAKLEPAIEEINGNELTGMYVTYDAIKGGSYGRVSKIVFNVTYSNDVKKDSISNDVESVTANSVTLPDEIFDFIEDVQQYFDEHLSLREAKSIAVASGYDMDKIKKAYALMKECREPINNMVGWIINAMKKNYSSEKIRIEKKDDKKPGAYPDFPQREYDSGLEAALLNITKSPLEYDAF